MSHCTFVYIDPVDWSALAMHWSTLSFTELSTAQLYALLRLRQDIFVVEQQCIYKDIDDFDQQAFHMLCTRDSELVAYQRCLPPGLRYPQSSLGRVLVASNMRGQGLGANLARRGIEHNLSRWPQYDICISAQARLQSFYESLGFVTEGDPYLEDDMPHQKMRYKAPAAALQSD
jgi:ElaA protein